MHVTQQRHEILKALAIWFHYKTTVVLHILVISQNIMIPFSINLNKDECVNYNELGTLNEWILQSSLVFLYI